MGFRVVLVVENPPASARGMRDTGSVSLPGDPMDRGPSGLQSMGLQRVRHD